MEPTEAAWKLLEEAIEGVLSDMKRCVKLGLRPAAEAICCGIVLGLYEAEKESPNGLLGWAADFPADMACHAARELLKTFPAEERTSTRNRLLEALGGSVGGWGNMIEGASNRLLTGR